MGLFFTPSEALQFSDEGEVLTIHNALHYRHSLSNRAG